jgi:hypothetical protein
MLDRLLHALIQSKNEAADDVLVEALRLGAENEKRAALEALLRRKTVRGLSGVIAEYARLPEALQLHLLKNVKTLHQALRACGRSDDVSQRLAAMKIIALGRQGKLAYVLSENLHESKEELSKAATEAIVALARWVATETRMLLKAVGESGGGEVAEPAWDTTSQPPDTATTYSVLMEQRPEIEAAVARAMDVHRGRHGQDLLRAGLLLADWPGSKTLAILQTAKHGGQGAMVRRLQQPPASEHVEAFLLGATHGQLRSHFGIALAHIEQAPVLDALLRKTHWLKDHPLQVCMHYVTRGVWWGEAELMRDLERRTPDDAARVGEWIAVSGCHDVLQDERLEKVREYVTRGATAGANSPPPSPSDGTHSPSPGTHSLPAGTQSPSPGIPGEG